MKKIAKILVLTLTICCIAPISAFASEMNLESKTNYEKPIIVSVETVEENLMEEYNYGVIVPLQARSSVNLSNGVSNFTVGKLKTNASFTTDTYTITKNTIKIGLQSISGAAEHIQVTLYTNNGSSVAVATLSLPWSSLASGTVKYVTFSNLDPTTKYYAVIKNTDTTESGTILGIAKQA